MRQKCRLVSEFGRLCVSKVIRYSRNDVASRITVNLQGVLLGEVLHLRYQGSHVENTGQVETGEM